MDLDDPVAAVIEYPGVEQLVLRLESGARAVLGNKVLVGERGLRIVVPPAVPCVAGKRVQVPPVLLNVLAVISLSAGQAEGALLQERVAAVPQRQPQAQPLLHVAEAGQVVLAPPVGARTSVLERQVAPRLAVGAVILAYRPPLALADIWPPLVPLACLPQSVLEPAEAGHPLALSAHRRPSLVLAARALTIKGGLGGLGGLGGSMGGRGGLGGG